MLKVEYGAWIVELNEALQGGRENSVVICTLLLIFMIISHLFVSPNSGNHLDRKCDLCLVVMCKEASVIPFNTNQHSFLKTDIFY